MDFAEWLKSNRQREKLSLRRLSEKIGGLCSDAYLSQLENRRYLGKKGKPMRPDREIVVALAEALNADVDRALALADYAPEQEHVFPAFLSKIDFSIFDPDDLRNIESFIKFKRWEKLFSHEESKTVLIPELTLEEMHEFGAKTKEEAIRKFHEREKKAA